MMDRRKFLRGLTGIPLVGLATATGFAVSGSTVDGKEFIALEAKIDRSGYQLIRIERKRAELKREIERRGASVIGSGVDSTRDGHRITVHGAFDKRY